MPEIPAPPGVPASVPFPQPPTENVPTIPFAGELHADELVKRYQSPGAGFDRVHAHYGNTYRDTATVIIIPNRTPMFDYRVIQAWDALIAPMNRPRAKIFAIGDEVGHAYNNQIAFCLSHPELSKFPYVLTLESDNLPPPDAHIRLLETIEAGHFDGVSGLYFTKGPHNMPMAYGDPQVFAKTGVLDFPPLDIARALTAGQTIEVNGIAMGCSLYRMDLFRQVPHPWFRSMSDLVEGLGPVGYTQDLYFCKNARRLGKRFAVDMRVKVGHLDFATGIVY